MKIKLNFSWKITLFCLILIAGSFRLSAWQWDRHQEKLITIAEFTKRLESPPLSQGDFLAKIDYSSKSHENLIYYQVQLEGNYDYKNEILIDNRRLEDAAGRHILTPFRLKNSDKTVLVNRGFIPKAFSKRADLIQFQKPDEQSITALIKTGKSKTFFMQPSDPLPNKEKPALIWLRADIDSISEQLPDKILPLIVEKVSNEKLTAESLIKTDSDKTEILVLPGNKDRVEIGGLNPDLQYPVPSPDQVLSAGRHLGYVYEWLFIAVLVGLIGFVVQIKRH